MMIKKEKDPPTSRIMRHVAIDFQVSIVQHICTLYLCMYLLIHYSTCVYYLDFYIKYLNT